MKLIEGIQDIKKFYPTINDEDFYKIIESDPTYVKGRDSVGKYSKWLLNLYKKGNLKIEDLYKATQYLQSFIDNLKKFSNKDIGQFKSLPDLYKAIEEVSDVKLSKSQKDRELRKKVRQSMKDAELVFESTKWEVWVPKTYEASCKLGENTQWCTATRESDHYYRYYIKQGPLFIIINKTDPIEKYQFHFESMSFMDRYDDSIYLNKFMLRNKDLYDYFYSNIEEAVIENRYNNLPLDQFANYADVNENDLTALIEGDISEIFDFYDNYSIEDFIRDFDDITQDFIEDYYDKSVEELKTNSNFMSIFNAAVEQAYLEGTLHSLLSGLYSALESALNKAFGDDYSYTFNDDGLTVTGVKNWYSFIDEEGGTILSFVAYLCRFVFNRMDDYVYFNRKIFNEYLIENIGEN